MNNDPSLPLDRIPPQELRALMELGVNMLLSSRTIIDRENVGDRIFKLESYDIPRDSILARDHIDGVEIRYREVEEEGWPKGSEMMMVHVRYERGVTESTSDKVFFMTSSPEDEAPELSVVFTDEETLEDMKPTTRDAVELRSVLIATHALA